MPATLTRERFSNPRWIFEPKLDGIRCLAFRKGKKLELHSRNELRLNDMGLRMDKKPKDVMRER
jgi:ATP-dependent DNA ligase